MPERYTLRFETRFVPKETDPIEMTPEQEAAINRLLQQQITRTLYTLEERLLYGRAVSDVDVIDGKTVKWSELPEAR